MQSWHAGYAGHGPAVSKSLKSRRFFLLLLAPHWRHSQPGNPLQGLLTRKIFSKSLLDRCQWHCLDILPIRKVFLWWTCQGDQTLFTRANLGQPESIPAPPVRRAATFCEMRPDVAVFGELLLDLWMG